MWPQFSIPNSLKEGKSWTAVFDSYDQRNENCFYSITIHKKDTEPISFMGCLDYTWAVDGMSDAEIENGLRTRLAEVAQSGKTNTNYVSNGPGLGGMFEK
jgi:nucleoside-specific outer membrane channel protein Tsx